MTTGRWLLAGVAGIVLLVLVSLLLVTKVQPVATGPATAVAGPSAPILAVAASPEALPQVVPSQRVPAPAAGPVEPTPPPLPDEPHERVKALEPLRREVYTGLAALGERVVACGLKDAALTLTLETLDRRVQVLEVQAASAGAATEEATGVPATPLDERAVRCVRGVLERAVLQAPSAVAGRRWQLAWGPGVPP